MKPFHPVLSCEEALRFERALLRSEECEWAAMRRAGSALATALLADWRELGGTGWRWDRFDGAATAVKGSDFSDAKDVAAGCDFTENRGFAEGRDFAKSRDFTGNRGLAESRGFAESSKFAEGLTVASGGCIGPRVLVLAGKGHNGGDALLAAAELVQRFDCIEIVVFRPAALEALRPLCRRAWDGLFALAAHRPGLRLRDASAASPTQLFAGDAAYVFCLDGLLGMQARPPLRGAEAAVLAAVNAAGAQIGLRAAVDLPSALGEAGAFAADFTYATGIAKRPVFKSCNSPYVGRLRYLDIGFFDDAAATAHALAATQADRGALPLDKSAVDAAASANAPAHTCDAPVTTCGGDTLACDADTSTRSEAAAAAAAGFGTTPSAGSAAAARVGVLTPAVLNPFHNWRSPFGDKRHYGHLFILGGSAQMPGALLMNVQAALRSGAGLVTAFAPQSVAAAFAAQAPEAMWVPWPETDEGTLALEGQHLLATRLPRADALLMGSGMGRSAETFALMEDIARTCDVPLILDADALQPAVLAAAARHPRHATGTAGAQAGGNAEAALPVRPVIITPHGGEFLRLCPQAPAPLPLRSPLLMQWRPGEAVRSGAPLPPPLSAMQSGADKNCGIGGNYANGDGRANGGSSTNGEGSAPAASAIDINDIDWTDALRAFCRKHGVVTILKGAQTRVANSEHVAYSLFGGPVLARGGSGDVLAGLLGGCLVQRPLEPYLAAQQAVCWHGLAAQQLARERGQVSVTTMELVHHLPGVLRGGLAGSA